MKLRSFSIAAVILLALGGAAGYNFVKTKITHKIRKKIHLMVQEEADKAEKRIIEKYDLVEWNDEEIAQVEEKQPIHFDKKSLNKDPELLMDLSITPKIPRKES